MNGRPVLGVAVIVPTRLVRIEARHGDGLASFAGGRSGVGFFEVGLDDVGIYLRRGDAGVSEEFLNVPDARAALEHFGGAGVAEAVNDVEVAESCPVAVKDELLSEVAGFEGCAAGGEEEYRRLRLPQQDGTDGFDIFGEVTAGDFADGYDTVFVSFAFDDAEHSFRQVDFVEGELAEFAAAQAGGVQHFEDGSVAEPGGRGEAGGLEEFRHLPFVHDAAREFHRVFELGDLRGEVGEEEPALEEEAQQLADDPDVTMDMGDADCTAAVSASAFEVAAERGKMRKGDVAHVGNAAAFGPFGEAVEEEPGMFQRTRGKSAYAAVFEEEGYGFSDIHCSPFSIQARPR